MSARDDAPPPAAGDWMAGRMGRVIREKDWTQTPLGPVEQWPHSLTTAVSIMLASGFPMLVLWGREYIQLYNDAYRPVLGATKHPGALGQRARDCWPEIWEHVLEPMFGSVMHGGAPISSEDLLFLLDRNGYLEETFFTFSYSAIRDDTGRPGGVLVTCVETTGRVIGERRLRTLREIAAHGSASHSVTDACTALGRALSTNPDDLPFSLLYLSDGPTVTLRAASGVGAGTAVAPDAIGIEPSSPAARWPVAQVIETAQPILVTELAEPGARPDRPGMAHHAIVLPIGQSHRPPALGALVAGVSPRRALDHEYRAFLDLVASHIATAVVAARAYETERERAEALAQIDRAKTTFFSNVSHEFRTPLTLLLGPIESTLDSGGTLTRPELERVHRNALRLLRLVNTLLDFSRIEAGRMQVCYEDVDLAAATTDLASAFRSLVEGAGLAYHVEFRRRCGSWRR